MAGQPNIIIIYTDDQGYGDLSCMGETHVRTPHLDALADSGVRFTDWYSNCPVCSGSRASLMTGQYPDRAGVNGVLSGARDTEGLPDGKPTIASALREEGYRTALFGKWHLGVTERSQPHNFGFDEWFGFLAGCIDYYSHLFVYQQARGVDPMHDLWENGREIWRNGEYMTSMITERSVRFIQEAASDSQPFFLYTAYNAPHYPMHAPEEYVRRFDHLPWDKQIMAAMISAVDDGVGEIVAELERNDIRDNTLIFFSADNGPSRETRNWLDGTRDPYYGGTTGGFKGHKSTVWEGGVREPAIMSWPARIPERQVCSEVGMMMDIFPTVLAAAGGDPSRYDLDGLDVMSMAADGDQSPHEDVRWNFHGQRAIRRGEWKLVLDGVLRDSEDQQPSPFLSNLADDPSEQNNLADEYPEMTGELTAEVEEWAGEQQQWFTEHAYHG
ncbi:MAG: sulfatase-like hydrolase/transferase [Armatimonadetes bacterium]|nr:sulfatase-like hydrolase/transferase [Armatimonadota bacterium]